MSGGGRFWGRRAPVCAGPELGGDGRRIGGGTANGGRLWNPLFLRPAAGTLWTGAMLSRFSTAAKGAPPEKPVEHETGNRTLLLIGAPIATEGLAWAIRGEYPNCRILRAFYAPYRTLKELYRPFLTADTLLFGDPAELAAWATPMSCWQIPSFSPPCGRGFHGRSFLACPEPGVCGRGGLPARWLEDVACVMSAIGKSHTW